MQPRKVVARVGLTSATVEVRANGHVVVAPLPGGDPAAGPPATYRTHYLGHGRLRLTGDGPTTLAYVVDAGDERWVFIDGAVLRVEFERPAGRRRAPRAGAHESLAAPMPATVVRVLVTPGETVSRGTPLVILEAMKMELPLRAPQDAVVTAVACQEGDLVQPGEPLVELDDVPAEGRG
jgi:acetyl/propionyl-CoA carboxylase alpha subunit